MEPKLHISKSPGSRVDRNEEGVWHLEIPANTRRAYRLAQLDDHGSLRGRKFHWKAPLKLNLQARVSAEALPGTWGFGLWNDPFSFLIKGGAVPRLPTLPDAAWFFYASPENYLSFRDDLAASGLLAATFKSWKIPGSLLILAAPFLSLALLPKVSQLVRKFLRRLIQQDSSRVDIIESDWHSYGLEWEAHQVRFSLDGKQLSQTNIAPMGPLCLVIWIDNQYAALPPGKRLRFGTLPNPEPAWMEIRALSIE